MYTEVKVRTPRVNPRTYEEKEVTVHYITLADEVLAPSELKALEACQMKGDVIAVYQSQIKGIVNGNEHDKPLFKATLVQEFVSDSGAVKELKYRVLVHADSFQEANDLLRDYVKQGLEDMRIDAINKTRIEWLA